MRSNSTSRSSRIIALTAASLITIGATSIAHAQSLDDVVIADQPLVLKSRGSFMVGGETVTQTAEQLSSIFATPPTSGGDVVINQMYVEYMVPQNTTGVPVVLLHGATLTGKTYDTTPDGRMGWYEYFVRRGHAAYVPDQVSRGRSGVDLSVYNDVRAGKEPASALPNVFKISDQLGWTMFRFGPRSGLAFDDEQFPTQAAGAFSRQAVPDLNATLPSPNPNATAMSSLASSLKGAVLLGHSESGGVPLDAALVNLSGIKALVLVEPGGCQASSWNASQLSTFANVPILAVFGDHLDVDTGTPGFSWNDAFVDCQKFIAKVNAVGGQAQMLHLPESGIKGNSHMMMMDRNNIEVADLILKWIDENAALDRR